MLQKTLTEQQTNSQERFDVSAFILLKLFIYASLMPNDRSVPEAVKTRKYPFYSALRSSRQTISKPLPMIISASVTTHKIINRAMIGG
jgi:hypothetical protein